MKLTHFFIDHPVFAAVISIMITLLGIIAYPTLPVAQYPEIAPPTVTIAATYPGATAETLAATVAQPIEEQINGVENMLYMSSQSTGDGHLTITVTFKLGTDPNTAQVLLQNRVAVAVPQLPTVVQQTGIVVRKASPDILLAVHFYSPDGTADQQYIANFVTLHVHDVLLRIPGVGDIGSRAARDYSMRVWIDPDKAAQRNITVEEIVQALKAHNTQVAAGAINAPPVGQASGAFQQNVDTEGLLTTPKEFSDIIVKRDTEGRITRIGDVARVDLGAADYTTDAYLSGFHAAAQGIQQQPGSNALETAAAIKATMAKMKPSFPPGVSYAIIYNPTEYVAASIDEVKKSLMEAMILVVIVIIVFLQTWRAAIIPIIAIPVSLVGTFAVMKAAGFSLNNLTLFGLVLAIGIVVDDAIVVVENVERRMREGLTPRDAAHATVDEVAGALIAIAFVLIAVFVPAAFITGITGQFYRQFALTIASATLISLIVSLTLSPALCALVLRPHGHRKLRAWEQPFSKFGQGFTKGFDWLSDRYAGLTSGATHIPVIMLGVYVLLLGVTVWSLMSTPTGFIPAQDQGNMIASIALPPGTQIQRTNVVVQKVMQIALHTPGVEAGSTYVGLDATSGTTNPANGQIYVILKPFAWRTSRGLTSNVIADDLRHRMLAVTEADVKIIPPPPVRGIGTAGGFKMMIEDQNGAGPQALEAVAHKVADAALKSGDVSNAFVPYSTRTPRLYAEIDRTKAEVLGVPDSNVFDTLQTYLGSTFINNFNYLNHTYTVYAQADWPFRRDESAIGQLQTRSSSGAMVPLGSVITLKHTSGPYRVPRYNLYPAAEIQGEAAPGKSSGQGIAAMEKAAADNLPPGFSYEWTDLAFQEKAAGGTGMVVFAMAVVFAFLLLAALYESVTLPFSVILIVPMCLLAAMLGVKLRHMDNNILTQVGLIVLIGLAAKNAILIVEFARQGELENGLDRYKAAVEAARTRLRPILMTSFAFIFGVAPLAFAVGAGAEMRQALGVAVFFGMIGVTVFGLIFTPVFYIVFRWVADRLPKPHKLKPAAEPAE
ncbi:MAG TPA: multidrug efflux RND transporter permease subunit [Caulobacteraceae bacterium]|jgi:HAE1 family hydrophobic/amphiphilic exporter-1